MKKKKLLSISLLCLFGMIVTACGGKPSSQPESQPASDNPSSEVTPASSNEPGTSETVQPSSAAPSSQAPSSQAPSSQAPSSEAPVNPTGVSLDKQTASIIKGNTLQLNATVAPANANNKEITWSSSDEDVITVSNSGLVTAVEVGSAKVTAKIKNTQLKAECQIDVIKEINSISITNKTAFANFVVDDIESLNITVDPADNVTALLNAGALKVVSSNDAVVSVSGLSVLAKAKGTAKVTATLFGKEDSVDITVGDAIPGEPYQILAALNKGITEAPWNGSTGKNGAITTTCFELTGKMIALAPNGATGYNAILDDGTQAVYLQVNKLEADPIPFEVGEYAKVTCKFINYYGLLEGVSRKAATGNNASWIPAKDVEKIDAPETPITPYLSAPEAMTGAQYDAYYEVCKTNGTKNAAGATWTSIKYASLLGEYSESYVEADKGKYKIVGSSDRGLAPIGSFELDEPFEGQRSTLEAFLIGANTGKGKSNAIVTGQTPVAVESVSFSPASISLVRGNTVKVEYVTAPAGSYDRAVAWSSDDETVATVEAGNVTGVYQGEGSKTANIKVTLGTGAAAKEATIAVEVFGEEIHAGSVELASTASVYVGKTVQLTATTTPAMVSDVAQWSSSDETVATVDNKGLVSGHKAGNANITVRYNENVSATCAVTVSVEPGTDAEHPLDVAAAIAIGSTLGHNKETETEYYVSGIISKIVSNDFGTDYNNGTFWLANGESVAEGFEGYRCKLDQGVSADNFKVGAEAVLRCKIKKYNTTIETGSVAQIVSLTYAARPVTSLSLDNETLSMSEGDEVTLKATYLPVYATETLTWSSSDESVATVEAGKVTAVAAGTATITVSASATMKKECAVTVIGSGEVPVGPQTVSKTIAELKTENGWENGGAVNSLKLGKVTFTFTGSGDSKYYDSGSNLRIYINSGSTGSVALQADADYTIVSVKFTYVWNKGWGSFPLASDEVGTINDTSKTYTITNTDDGNEQLRITAISVTYQAAGETPVQEEALPWYTEGEGNQAIHFEGAGIWTWVKYDEMGYEGFAQLSAAKDNFEVAYESDPATTISQVVVSDDNATLKYARVYVSLGAAYNTGTLSLTIPSADGTVNYVGTLEFDAGVLTAINGEAVVVPVEEIAQPSGTYSGLVSVAGTGAFTTIALTNEKAFVEIGSDKATLDYTFDNETGLVTIPLGGNYGNLTGTYDEENDKLVSCGIDGAYAAAVTDNGSLEFNHSLAHFDCEGDSAALQGVFKRRVSGNENGLVTADTTNFVAGASGVQLPGNGSGDVRLNLRSDLGNGAGITAKNLGYWVYNPSSSNVKLRMWIYKAANLGSNAEIASSAGVEFAPGWTYYRIGFTEAKIYNIQIADFSNSGVNLTFDNIAIF